MSLTSKELGKLGEAVALQYLKDKGFLIKELNYTFLKGEIDIIAADKDEIVFIEVKSRGNLDLGDPVEGVTPSKVKQIKKVAEFYLYEKKIENIYCRFDVVTVLFLDIKNPTIEHYINAFD